MRIICLVFLGHKGLNRPNGFGRITISMAFLASFCSCSQTLSVPANSSASSVATAQDFFWQNSDLSSDSGLDYNVVRNGTPSDHRLISANGFSSPNGDEIEDRTLNTITLVVHSSVDSISIDSMGANSIFSLPAGFSIGTDSAPGSLLILITSKLDSGDTWYAGNLTGQELQQGVPVWGQVLDRDDSLIVTPARAGALSAFGESVRIKYLPIIEGDTASVPIIYWIAYYTKGVGLVRIEEYSKGLLADDAQIVSQ
jgi:hypothetical protein